MQGQKKTKTKYISLSDATQYCEYSQEYLSLLARRGVLPAVKLGRNWFTTRKDVLTYVNKIAIKRGEDLVPIPEEAEDVPVKVFKVFNVFERSESEKDKQEEVPAKESLHWLPAPLRPVLVNTLALAVILINIFLVTDGVLAKKGSVRDKIREAVVISAKKTVSIGQEINIVTSKKAGQAGKILIYGSRELNNKVSVVVITGGREGFLETVERVRKIPQKISTFSEEVSDQAISFVKKGEIEEKTADLPPGQEKTPDLEGVDQGAQEKDKEAEEITDLSQRLNEIKDDLREIGEGIPGFDSSEDRDEFIVETAEDVFPVEESASESAVRIWQKVLDIPQITSRKLKEIALGIIDSPGVIIEKSTEISVKTQKEIFSWPGGLVSLGRSNWQKLISAKNQIAGLPSDFQKGRDNLYEQANNKTEEVVKGASTTLEDTQEKGKELVERTKQAASEKEESLNNTFGLAWRKTSSFLNKGVETVVEISGSNAESLLGFFQASGEKTLSLGQKVKKDYNETIEGLSNLYLVYDHGAAPDSHSVWGRVPGRAKGDLMVREKETQGEETPVEITDHGDLPPPSTPPAESPDLPKITLEYVTLNGASTSQVLSLQNGVFFNTGIQVGELAEFKRSVDIRERLTVGTFAAFKGDVLMYKSLTTYGKTELQDDLTVGDEDFHVDTTAGNVGIGTLYPQEKLDVAGNVKVGKNLLVVDEAHLFDNLLVDGYSEFIGILNANGGIEVDGDRFVVDGKTGSVETAGSLTVEDQTWLNSNVALGDAIGDTLTVNARVGSDLIPKTTTTYNLGSSSLYWNRLYANNVYTAGNVGIGTETPGAELEVAGQVKITGGSPGLNRILRSDADGLATWVTLGAASVTPDSLDYTEFEDAMDLDASTTVTFSDYDYIFNLDSTGDFRVQDNGADVFIIDDTANVGIGTTGPDQSLDVLNAGTQLRLSYVDSNAVTDFATGQTGDLTIDPSGGNVLLANGDTLIIGGALAQAYNVIGDTTTNMGHSLASDDDLYIEGDLEVDGSAWFDGGITTPSLAISGLTASRLVATDSAKNIVSSDLYAWVTGTANRVTVADDADGTITLSAPQDIHTAANPTFAGLNADAINIGITSSFEIDTDSNILLLDSSSGTVKIDDDLYITGQVKGDSSFAFGGADTESYNVIGDTTTNMGHSLASDDDLYIEGDLEVDGTAWFDGGITTPSLAISGLTASRLVATDAAKNIVSSDLYAWVTGTANRVTVADDADGTITLSAPQDIHTAANPTFAGLNADAINIGITSSFEIDTDSNILLLDSNSGTVKIDDNLYLTGKLQSDDSFAFGGAATQAYNVVGDTTTNMGHSLASDDDLYIEGDFEVDGSAWFDASVTIADDFTVDTNTLFVDSDTNRVRIGTTGPVSDLNVQNTYAADDYAFTITSDTTNVLIVVPNASNWPPGSSGATKLLLGGENGETANLDFYNWRAIGTDNLYDIITTTKAAGNDFAERIRLTGNIATADLRLSNTKLYSTDSFAFGGAATQAYNVVGDTTTNMGHSLASDDDLYIEGDLEVDGTAWFDGGITTPSLAISGLTASRLVATDAAKNIVSSDLYAWVTGTANRVTVADDADGTITLSAPQDIHTAANPTFAGLNADAINIGITSSFEIDTDSNILLLDSSSGTVKVDDNLYITGQVKGDSSFAFGGADTENYNVIGDTTTNMGHSLASDDDLYIEGDLEVDGSAWFDGGVTAAGDLTAYTLYLYDTNQSHLLHVLWNEDDSAHRILNLAVGGGNRAFTLNEDLTIGDGQNVTITALGQANTLTLNESFTIGDGNDGTLTYSASSKTLTVEDDSYINQDLTTDANPTFAGLNADAINIGITSSFEIDTDSNILLLDSNSGTVKVDDDLYITGQVKGDSSFAFGGADTESYNVIGDTTTNMGHSLASDDDLYIEGDLEVDGSAWFDGGVTAAGDLTAYTLYLYDTNQSHLLHVLWNEDDSAHRILNLAVGGGNRAFTLNEDLTIGDGQNVTITALGQANTLTLNESFTIGDGNDGTLTYSASSKTLTVEDDSYINQDLTTDANPTFAGLNADAINIGITSSFEIDTDSNILLLDSSSGTVKIDDDLYITGQVKGDSSFAFGGADTQNYNVIGDTTTNMGHSLASDDDLYIEGDLEVDGSAWFDASVTIADKLTVDGTTLHVNSDTNRVGIGTVAPTRKLHVLDGYIKAENDTGSAGIDIDSGGTTSSAGIKYQHAGTDYWYNYAYGEAFEFREEIGYKIVLILKNDGNVGIGTTGPDQKLEVLDTGPQLRLSYVDTNAVTDFQTGQTGDLTITPSGNNILFSDSTTFAIGGASAQSYNVIGDTTTNMGHSLASDDDLYIEGDLEVDGSAWFDGGVTAAGDLTAYTLYLYDTNQSHLLHVLWNEDDSAHRILNLAVGGGNRAFTLNEDLTIGDGQNVTITALGQANTLTLNESFTIGDGNDGTLTYSASSKTLTVEDDSYINQDLTTDANPTFAGLNADAINIGITSSFEIDTDSNILLLDSNSGTVKIDDDLYITGQVKGDSSFAFGGADTESYNVIGDTTTNMGHSLSSDDDLYIEGDLEVDGSAWFDASVTIADKLTVDGTTLHVNSDTNRVGIGTVSPAKNLDIYDATGAELLLVRDDSSTEINNLLGQILFDANDGLSSVDASVMIRAYASEEHITINKGGYLTFETKRDNVNDNQPANEWMRLTSAGFLGINTTLPDRKLDVLDASNPQLRLTYTDGSVYSEFQTDSGGDLTIDMSGGNLLLADADTFAVGGTLGQAYNVIGDTTTGMGHSLSSDDDLYLEGDLEVDGTAWFDGGITTPSLAISGLTASRLVATDAAKNIVSSDLYAWVTGTANRVTVADDADGTITLSAPQDIHTAANPTFAGLNADAINIGITSSFEIDTDSNILLLDSSSGTVKVDDNLYITGQVKGDSSFAFGGADTESYNIIGDTTTNMGHSLASDDDLYIEGDLEVDGSAWFDASVTIADKLTVDGTTLHVNSDTNRVGIGTTGPTAKLEVSGGNLKMTSGNIALNGNWLSKDGDNEGLYIQSNGYINNFGEGATQNFVIIGTALFRGATFSIENASAKNILVTSGNNINLVTASGGNVGINTVGPDRKLDILDATNPQLRLTHTDGSVYVDMQATSAGHLSISGSGGNVGIGTTTPTSKLHIFSPDDADSWNSAQPLVEITNLDVNATDAAALLVRGGANNVVGLTFQVQDYSGNTDFVITGNGNVGIGTASPNLKVEWADATRSGFLDFGLGGVTIGGAAGNNLALWTNGNQQVTIDTNGNVGIGTTAPDKILEINKSTGGEIRLTYNDSDGSAANYADFSVGSGGDLTIDASGGNLLLADSDTFAVGGALGQAYNVIGDTTTNMGHSLASDDDLYIEGDLEVDGTAWFDGGITTPSLAISGLTASRLVATDAAKNIVSSDLYAWVTGTANRVTVADDADGTITLSAPQDIHTAANPTFAGLNADAINIGITSSFEIDTDSNILLLDSSSGTVKIDDDLYITGQVKGDSSFAFGGADTQNYNVIGDTTTNMGHSLASDDDLYIEGDLEVDGSAWFDSAITVAGDITLTGHLLPSANDQYDLGSDSLRWRDLYLGPGSVHMGVSGNEAIIGYDTTSNYITFDPDGDTTAEMVIDDSGNVGIGTTGPDRKLDIIDSSNPQLRLSYVDSNAYADFQVESNGYLGILPSGKNVGIGTTSPSALLHVAESRTSGTITKLSYPSATTLAGSVIGTDIDLLTNLTPGSYDITGLQITMPSTGTGDHSFAKFIEGSTTLYDFNTVTAQFDVPTSFNAAGDVSLSYDLILTNANASYIKSNGSLYIEAGDPNQNYGLTLSANGSGRVIVSDNFYVTGPVQGDSAFAFGGADTQTYNVIGDTTTNMGHSLASDDDLYIEGDLEVDGSAWFDASVTIADTLTVAGDILATSGVHIGVDTTPNLIDDATNGSDSTTLYIGNKIISTEASDARKKDVIGTTGRGLQDILEMKVVDFTWKPDFDIDSSTINTGILAQEMYQILPSVVRVPPDEETGLWSIQYNNMVPVLVRAIQEQQGQLSVLDDEMLLVNDQIMELSGIISDSMPAFSALDLEIDGLGEELADYGAQIDDLEVRVGDLEGGSDTVPETDLGDNGDTTSESEEVNPESLQETLQTLVDSLDALSGLTSQLGILTDSILTVMESNQVNTARIEELEAEVGELKQIARIVDEKVVIGTPDQYLVLDAASGLEINSENFVLDPDGNVTIAGELNLLSGRINSESGVLELNPGENEEGESKVVVRGDLEVEGDLLVLGTSTEPAVEEVEGEEEERDSITGVAVISAGDTEIVVDNDNISADSLIYITPVSPTQGQVLFVAEKREEEVYDQDRKEWLAQGFTVAVEEEVGEDIEFNWWIVDSN